ncbi:MAG: efflux RND transporter periplasmic adaptor subunit, partial [Myxococcota bacterium]
MRAIERTVLLAVTIGGAVHCAAAADDTGSSSPSSPDAAASVDRAPQVETLTVEPRQFVERIEVTGRTEAVRDATLSAQSAGTVEDLVPLGASARKGQILARFDPGLLKAQVRGSKAAVEAAQAAKALAQESYERQKPLFEGKIISALEFRKIRSDLASAQAQLAQAQAELAQSMKSLENTLVIAPFDGVVESRAVKEGEQVAPGSQ